MPARVWGPLLDQIDSHVEFPRLTPEEVASPLRAAVDQFGLSARAYDRIPKAARTIADLEGAAALMVHRIAEMVQ